MKLVFTASRGSAAALLKTSLINYVFHLGRSRDKINIAEDTASPNSISKLRRKLIGIDGLILDEVSMCRPVMIARIDHRLR